MLLNHFQYSKQIYNLFFIYYFINEIVFEEIFYYLNRFKFKRYFNNQLEILKIIYIKNLINKS